ncbi:flagellar filament capping protein FliD [Sanguibacter sp. A247]|uniref:flagellar filament capping protein FliD n=1 Tax=unclassified Sanguibacter TaxID=2645534 RepID=UPI003FD7AE94
MAGFGIDGIVSGLDTTAMINQLMQVEARQQTLLNNKKISASATVAALQGLNTRFASLAETAKKVADPSSWTAVTASSSSPAVTVAAGAKAAAGSIRFTVDALATAQSSLVTLPADLDTSAPSLTVRIGSGDPVTVSPLSTDPRDLAAAINKADLGVSASVINVGTAEAPENRLQLTATSTGTHNGFTVEAATTTGTRALDLVEISAASDARLTLFPGSAAERTVTSASNSVAGVIEDVTFTLTAATEEPVTVDLVRDSATITKTAQGLVSTLNVLLEEISSRTKATTTTTSDGSTKLTPGILASESLVRGLGTDLLSIAGLTAGGETLANVGITLGRDGRYAFDAKAFGDALAADPAKAQALVTALADAGGAIATRASDPQNGTLTSRIRGTEGAVKDLGDRIVAWDDRLAVRRATLERTYAALEVSLSKLNSTSSWLEQQLSQLQGTKK